MYGAPGPGYQGHNEAENEQMENEQIEVSLSHPANTANTARLIYPEYMCFFPTIFFRGTGACEQDCPEDVRENAKCERNGWRWADRVAELRTERAEREREKAEKEREKANKNKKEMEESENDGH
jgi:hypothetical protein